MYKCLLAACLAFLNLSAPMMGQDAQDFPSPRALIEKADAQAGSKYVLPHYTYFLLKKTQNRFFKGKLFVDETILYEYTWIGDLPYGRIVEVQGKPLKGKALVDEQARYDKAVADHASLDIKQRIRANDHLLDPALPLKPLLTETYSTREIRQETLAGNSTHVIDCTPVRSGSPGGTGATRHVTLWITDAGVILRSTYEVVADEADRLRGSHGQEDYQLIDGNRLPQHSLTHLNAPNGNTADFEDTFSRYRRFNVAVHISSADSSVSDGLSAVPAAVTAVPGKMYAFEVATMRPNPSSTGNEIGKFGPTANGYSVKNMSLRNIVMTAFAPQVGSSVFYTSEQIKGMPDWADSEHYDIEARISEKDRGEWQNPQSQKKMLQAMLLSLLEERCKFAAHREVKTLKVLTLELAKDGPKFKESTPGEVFPPGIKLPWGGVVVPTARGMKMYGTTMSSFATVLAQRASSGYPIQNRTGLQGTYDITLEAEAPIGSPAEGTATGQSSAGESDLDAAMLAAVNALGLKLVPTRSETETLIIEHLDRPTEN